MTVAAIDVESVSKSFGADDALVDVDISVNAGEFFIVVGPSGCGKSTLLECLVGLHRPDDGTIRLFGDDVTHEPTQDRGMGYVFQDFDETLFPHRSVAENIAFGLRMADDERSEEEIEQVVDDMLQLLSIEETKSNVPSQLSGGQQQRVELARQLVRDCDVTLLDDPLSDLDYKLRKRMELELRRLHRERAGTFVFVTHNQEQALKLADRMIVMNDGWIEQTGTPTDIYNKPETAFVGRFVGDSNVIPGVAASIDEDGIVAVDTAIDHFDVRAVGSDMEPGHESLLLIRPEDIRTGPSAEGCANQVDATLEDRTYMGDATEFVFSVDGVDDDFLVVESGHVEGSPRGATVTLGWETDAGMFFKDLSVSGTTTIADLQEL